MSRLVEQPLRTAVHENVFKLQVRRHCPDESVSESSIFFCSLARIVAVLAAHSQLIAMPDDVPMSYRIPLTLSYRCPTPSWICPSSSCATSPHYEPGGSGTGLPGRHYVNDWTTFMNCRTGISTFPKPELTLGFRTLLTTFISAVI
jgi:hypothetical protein